MKLDVTAPDRPPIADAQQLTTQEDLSLPLTLTGSDPDGDPLTFEIVQPPLHGTLVGTAPVLTYVPAADYNGPDEFTFAVSDGRAPIRGCHGGVDRHRGQRPAGPRCRLGNRRRGRDAAAAASAAALRQPCGVIYGDPHLSSFDAALYDFQAVGEFIGAKSTTDDFELQARFAPVPPLRTVSIAIAVAMRVAGHRVAFYRTLTGFDTRIDGAPFTVTPNPQALPGGGTIGTYGYPNEVTVVWPDGSVAIVDAVGLYPQYYRFTVELGLAAARLTHFVGLLGQRRRRQGERPRHARRPDAAPVSESAVQPGVPGLRRQLADQPGRVAVRLRAGGDDRDVHRPHVPRCAGHASRAAGRRSEPRPPRSAGRSA